MNLTRKHYSLVLESFDLCVFLSVCLLCEMLLSTVPPFPVGQQPTLPHRYHGNTNEREPHTPKLTLRDGARSDVPYEISNSTGIMRKLYPVTKKKKTYSQINASKVLLVSHR